MDLALFDFDGTITTREMYADFIQDAVEPRRLRIGKVLLAPLLAGYRLGVVSPGILRAAIVRIGFSGVDEEKVRAAGQRFADGILQAVLRPEAMQRIAWHKARGDEVVVVSGALDLYLAPWCHQRGLALLCSALESRQGVLTGRYLGRQCVGREKPRRVLERYDLADFGEVHAYGDTVEDLDLLAIASRKSYRWQAVR